ncbi:Mitochondrial protein cyt-4 [Ophiocordyceps camponoti-floridani]|uniref:Mitochondrial protein cyt-4 n=1 Tax=Ophiocordyceps camponoti-floridani TaxID=2030778 RepID=A0A8H4VDJ9_9HYPO|nr:Mitochondrial protein cyt-4 [Ophiocordyceps camponoti-floridani]
MLSRLHRRPVCILCLAPARVLVTGRIASLPLASGVRLYSPLPTYEPNESRLWQEPPKRGLPIRETLRKWEEENESLGSENLPSDLPPEGELSNCLTRTQTTGAQGLVIISNRDVGLSQNAIGEGQPDEVASTSSSADCRIPGNLVELKSIGSRVSNLAIYIGYFGGCYHFFSVNGTWMLSMSFPTAFTVTRFAPPDLLDSILEKIPEDGTPEFYFDLQSRSKGPKREDGEILMNLMADFRTEANVVYARHIGELDNIQQIVPRTSDVEYLSLVEVADRILPATLRLGDGSFPPHVLYAVFKGLTSQDIACPSVNTAADCRRPDHLFEIYPPAYALIVDKVSEMVREYVSDVMSKEKPAGSAFTTTKLPPNIQLLTTPLLTFIKEARHVVLQSRRHRTPSSCGLIKPSSAIELEKPNFSATSREVLKFLEYWSVYNIFAPECRLHSHGATILRALDLYPDRDLNQGTAWLFLQEAGILSPWELPSRFKHRMPGVPVDKNGGLSRPAPRALEESMRPDIAAGHRRDRRGETVFCIDAASTSLIDDGVSLERTKWDTEFWIHIHVADPASRLLPNSEVSKYIELLPENVYLPGHYDAMIPSHLGLKSTDPTSESLVQQFSLRPGGPAFTFSARVNRAGDVLDSKIEPCTLGDVVYLAPEDVANFCDQPPPPPLDEKMKRRLAVGNRKESTWPLRQMDETDGLTVAQKDDLTTLYQLAEAIKQKRLSKGAWPHYFPKPSVSVGFEASSGEKPPQGAKLIPADPYIEVGTDLSIHSTVVSSLMVLAGEVAASWCAQRSIPIPYRRNTKAANNMEDAYEYATEVLYPLVRKGIRPTPQQQHMLTLLTGDIELSPRPGPYFLMGIDMYTKATSPLRRFGDLLVHWQIHAALAFEREHGRKLNQSKDDLAAILPFTASGLNLPWLKIRERTARRIGSGSLDWTLIALARAWLFEGKKIGQLRFRVRATWARGLLGQLDLFDVPARLDVEELGDCRLLKDTKIGDEFAVELVDVNVYSRNAFVKALQYLGGGG